MKTNEAKTAILKTAAQLMGVRSRVKLAQLAAAIADRPVAPEPTLASETREVVKMMPAVNKIAKQLKELDAMNAANGVGPQHDHHVADRRLALAGVDPSGKPQPKPRKSRAKSKPLANVPELTAESKVALEIATRGVANSSTPAQVAAELKQLTAAQQQMADDGCPLEAFSTERKPVAAAPLAGGQKLPRSAPGRELAVPAAKPTSGTPQTKRDQEAAAKRLGLSIGGKKPAKTTRVGAGAYDWTAAEADAKSGKLPKLPPFKSYDCHMADMLAFAEKGDVDGLKTYGKGFRDRLGGRANMFRFFDLLLVALKKSAK